MKKILNNKLIKQGRVRKLYQIKKWLQQIALVGAIGKLALTEPSVASLLQIGITNRTKSATIV